MAYRHKQPFYSGAGTSSFPLRQSPYYSRVESQELKNEGGIDGEDTKNYQFVAFRPGFSLQASELNEIQEHFQMQLTLSISMMHNWITSGRGHLWGGYSDQSLHGEGGNLASDSDIGGREQSIGQGGGINSDDGSAFHDPARAVSAPGWRGSCPLHPYESPYQGIANSAAPVTAQYFPTGNYVRLTFWPGWWLTELRAPWSGIDSQNNEPDYISGLKHWVYLDHNNDGFEADPSYQLDIGLSTLTGTAVAGLNVNSLYYGCEGDETSDPDLADNAAGLPNSAACGASRYSVFFQGAALATPGNDGEWGDETDWDNPGSMWYDKESISAVCKIDPTERTVRYMNNMIIATF